MHLRVDIREASPDAEVATALEAYLDAVRASVEASRALLSAGPGERHRAHHAFMEATRRQAVAERAYERARQQAANAPYAGRPRMKL